MKRLIIDARYTFHAARNPIPSSRLPVVAAKPGTADSYARLLERIEGQLIEVVDRYSRHQRRQRQQHQPQQAKSSQQARPKPSQPQPLGAGALRPTGGTLPPQPPSQPDAKRPRLGGGGAGSGSGGGSGGAAYKDGASPEVLVQWLLNRYVQSEEKTAAAAAAAGAAAGAAAAAAGDQAWEWRMLFTRMLQRVPALHEPLTAALAAAAEGQPPDPKRAAALASLLACMAACRPGLEAVVAPAAVAGARGSAGESEVQLVAAVQPSFAWHCRLQTDGASPSTPGAAGAAGGSSIPSSPSNSRGTPVYGETALPEFALPHLPAAAWPDGMSPPATASRQAAAAAAAGIGSSMPGCAVCCAVMRRCRLGSAAQLCGAARFWGAYLERVAGTGWWCTAGERTLTASGGWACGWVRWVAFCSGTCPSNRHATTTASNATHHHQDRAASSQT